MDEKKMWNGRRHHGARSAALLLAALLALPGCNVLLDFDRREEGAYPPVVVRDDLDYEALKQDAFTLERAAVVQGRLHLTVSFGGGCRTHAFTLYSTPPIIETYPLGADLYLVHADPGDPCDSVVRQKLVFDLAPLRRLKEGPIQLFVRDYAGDVRFRLRL